MSDAIIVAMIAAVPACATVVLAIMARGRIEHVVTLTNSNYSKLAAEVKRAHETIAELAKAGKAAP